MIAGHFGLAAGVKAHRAGGAALGADAGDAVARRGVRAALPAKVERIDVIGGGPPGYGNGIIHADYTHSLVGAARRCRWSSRSRRAGAGGGAPPASWARSSSRTGSSISSCTGTTCRFCPGAPADTPRVGFGLWRWPLVTAAAELALVLWGWLAYLRAAVAVARAHDPARIRRARIAAGAVLVSGLLTLGLSVAGL